ncbi:GTP-binding protein [Mycena sanguinolenta]|uniref:GTP-binding protein n=1 Tax=Mycena sanguinolenta TaxID=230812 RepID=A0A8H6YMB3_9AGAR|nr:GTP-binding protein [Mycena sanguinolenta]
MHPDAKAPSENDLSFWNDRDLRFRVLILGRANAGKTTILERLTGATMDQAEVWRDGEILPGQTVKGQIDRGLHNINDEICFRSRPGFVFHDSRGVEAGSAVELSTVQQFLDERSSAATDLRTQLHVIWMCLPLDECRELFDSERDIFRLLKGAAPLVVIFTKQDGALSKETSQLLMEFPENSCTRSVRKEARRKAELEVVNRVKELKGELMAMGLVDDATAFLTTSGMEMPTVEADKSCQQLIELTEECLTGPRIKTLLSMVWGRNLLRVLNYNTSYEGVKLGSGAPEMWNLIKDICIQMVSDMADNKHAHRTLSFWNAVVSSFLHV